MRVFVRFSFDFAVAIAVESVHIVGFFLSSDILEMGQAMRGITRKLLFTGEINACVSLIVLIPEATASRLLKLHLN